ncbi:MAG: sigma-54 dependent transcriptional regulator [Acidobacteriia bacterium]|nr:sigma-54 dependent transcriptional regulator [Terriglobia bacterium]
MAILKKTLDARAAVDIGTSGETPDVRSFLGMTAVISSARMRTVMRFVERIARSNAAVLISGESGTGKELIARALHEYSPRSSKPWIDINCAALPDHLLESELFGFEKGAFSGADSQKQGMFELADQGTLFLDEIGELNLKSQSKLLRVLDGFPHYRLGGTRKIAVDARIVAATNADLENEIRLGRFRADLFHRLNQVRVAVPALRERPDDIGPLARLFLEQQNPALTITEEAIEALECYSWPGNVRELRSLMNRLAVLANGTEIQLEDLAPPPLQGVSQPIESAPNYSLDKLEQEVICHALEQADGRRNRAAELLGISRRTLIRRLKLYGVNPTRPLVCSGTGVN